MWHEILIWSKEIFYCRSVDTFWVLQGHEMPVRMKLWPKLFLLARVFFSEKKMATILAEVEMSMIILRVRHVQNYASVSMIGCTCSYSGNMQNVQSDLLLLTYFLLNLSPRIYLFASNHRVWAFFLPNEWKCTTVSVLYLVRTRKSFEFFVLHVFQT
jgi:hypothetical protein